MEQPCRSVDRPIARLQFVLSPARPKIIGWARPKLLLKVSIVGLVQHYSEYGRRHILRKHNQKRSLMQTVLCLNFFADAHYYYLDWV